MKVMLVDRPIRENQLFSQNDLEISSVRARARSSLQYRAVCFAKRIIVTEVVVPE